MLVLVFFGLWVGREHLRDVLRKALKGDDRIDDSGEMLSYRAAVLTWLAGVAVMDHLAVAVRLAAVGGLFDPDAGHSYLRWFDQSGSRGGVAAAVGPMISSSVLVSAVGSSAIGPAGMVGLAYTYVWSADIRTFVMASCAHGLKLGEELGSRLRPLFGTCCWRFLSALSARSPRFCTSPTNTAASTSTGGFWWWNSRPF